MKVNLESFKVGGLGPFAFLGVWGDQEELIRYHKYKSNVKLFLVGFRPTFVGSRSH